MDGGVGDGVGWRWGERGRGWGSGEGARAMAGGGRGGSAGEKSDVVVVVDDLAAEELRCSGGRISVPFSHPDQQKGHADTLGRDSPTHAHGGRRLTVPSAAHGVLRVKKPSMRAGVVCAIARRERGEAGGVKGGAVGVRGRRDRGERGRGEGALSRPTSAMCGGVWCARGACARKVRGPLDPPGSPLTTVAPRPSSKLHGAGLTG